MSALDRVRKVGEGATINGTYAMEPEPALEAFRKDLLLLTAVSVPIPKNLHAHFKRMQEMATAICEHAFRAGVEYALKAAKDEGFAGMSEAMVAQTMSDGWSDYDPSEKIKALS